MERSGATEEVRRVRELITEAKVECLAEVQAFVDEILESRDCPMKIQLMIDVAVEELFVNIASYAYPGGTGEAVIQVEVPEGSDEVKITFIDSGIPYDPTVKEDPDITTPAAARSIGGLGIFMVKKSMDQMTYRREDGKNILTIEKKMGS